MSRRKQTARLLRILALRINVALNLAANSLDPPVVVNTIPIDRLEREALQFEYEQAVLEQVARIARSN